MIDTRDLLDAAIDIAHLGGQTTLRWYQQRVTVDRKADASPVTVADRTAEQVMRAAILERFPDHAVLGEEEGASGGDAAVRWILDPIDGTKTFVQGVPLYGTLVGIEVEGVPTIGVIEMPALSERVAAGTGLGCWWNGRRAWVSETTTLSDSVILTYDLAAARKTGQFDNLVGKVRFVRTWGDCYAYVLVATGRADAVVDGDMKRWDCAPMLPILEEAGGRFTTVDGTRTIAGGDVVASNGHIHEALLQELLGTRPGADPVE